jgi:poly(3-hydroxybutyrate) depolymerase
MNQRILFNLFISIGLTVNAQTINLRGAVSNQAGKPVANAIVALLKQGLKDTTGTTGAYSLTKNTAVVLPLLVPESQTITLYRGFLDFSLPGPSPVKVEIFDLKGKLLKKESLQNAVKGFYRFNIEENFRTAKLLIIKASIGQDEVTFRYLPLKNGSSMVHQSNESSTPVEGNTLTKVTAISDTLKTTAAGYTTKVMTISNYDQQLNITLDSVGGGGAKPSPGCGKATTLAKDKDQTFTVTAGSAGSRTYIIRIPADYDQNHPYALWFTPHCLNGTASGVATGSAGTHYEYYGIWKFANPTGGKGTTVFCSPQGISNGWGQGAKDLEFFRYMINKFENELCIDMSRIFSEGFSMGGSMSYALACAMPDTFRAVCMHSGGSMSGCDGSHRGPVPMFITHGTADGTCTWPGSGVSQINDLAKRDGCQTEDLASKCKPTDKMHPVCVEYQNCNPGYPCRACIFNGGHEASPGTEGSWGEGNTWVPDSTWSFFKRFY